MESSKQKKTHRIIKCIGYQGSLIELAKCLFKKFVFTIVQCI